MSKYFCSCGSTFKDKSQYETHIKIREHQQDAWPHVIFKKRWKGRFAAWFFNYPWSRLMRFVGAYIIYFVLIHHFHIDWTWWEATLIGIGMGLYIE